LWRIAEGVRRFVLENPKPFIVKVNHGGADARVEPLDAPLSTVTAQRRGHALVAPTMVAIDHGSSMNASRPATAPIGTTTTKNRHALVAAFLAKHFGGPRPGRPGVPLNEPMGTVTATDHHALAAVTLAHFRGTHPSQPGACSVTTPLPTITAGGIHVAEVRAFLMAYYGNGSQWQDPGRPLRTITAKHRLGLVTVQGEEGPEEYQVVDIGMRMLEPEELLVAQFGRFAAGYDLRAARSKAAKVRLIGNSVCPEVAEALVRANMGAGASERRAA